MSAFLQSPVFLAKKDFSLFHQLFCREIDQLLPVSTAVFFWEQDGGWLPEGQAEQMLGPASAELPDLCASLEPAVINSALVLPLELEGGDNIAAIVGELDPGLLRKMAPEWLHEFRATLQHALVRVKQAYIYPETGLYSSRLLKELWSEFQKTGGAFFLIGAQDGSRRSTGGLVKIMQTAHLLEAIMSGPVCYFGGNVFGVYQEKISRDSALHFARRLLGRLKREGLRNVHIGITLVYEQEQRSLDRVLAEGWEALGTAEQRGPFSLCEASFPHNGRNNPLARPAPEVVRQLQNKWRGRKGFCLLLIRIEASDQAGEKNKSSLEQLVTENFQDTYFFVPVHSGEGYILLPDVTVKKGMQTAGKIKAKLDTALGQGQVAVGTAHWPCLDFSRTAAIVNCRKALMHGDFLGPGSVTLFDHVSLNVSGDYFFDEGDYRQSVRDYRAGLKMNPDDVNLMNSLGVALTELNRLAEAERYFDLVLEKEPGNFMALVNKGFALRMLKKNEEALACFAAAEKCREFAASPAAGDISLQLARLYGAGGQYKQAVRVLEKMKARNSEKPGYLLYSMLGGAYAATGKNKQAIAMLQHAIGFNPHDARSLSLLGNLYGAEGQGDDIALALCSQAVNIDDRSWENWYRLAMVKFRMGDYDGAHEAVRESLRRNRKAVDAVFLAGRLYMAQGKRKQAARMFQRVLRAAPDYPGASRALQKAI
ncbi:MAG: tetratricopeptide repeat protein [Desulfobulbaceae bacterium]|nr:tetratricopeptide repeat protein [Desulfobulbaceae bacterium]